MLAVIANILPELPKDMILLLESNGKGCRMTTYFTMVKEKTELLK